MMTTTTMMMHATKKTSKSSSRRRVQRERRQPSKSLFIVNPKQSPGALPLKKNVGGFDFTTRRLHNKNHFPEIEEEEEGFVRGTRSARETSRHDYIVLLRTRGVVVVL